VRTFIISDSQASFGLVGFVLAEYQAYIKTSTIHTVSPISILIFCIIADYYIHWTVHLGHYEKLPYSDSTLRSVYHVRKYEVSKLSQVS